MKNHWSQLAATLSERRNLESLLSPANIIGSRSSGYRYLSPIENKRRLEAIRKAHRSAQREAGGLRRIAARVESLKLSEAKLWHLCRPDLY